MTGQSSPLIECTMRFMKRCPKLLRRNFLGYLYDWLPQNCTLTSCVKKKPAGLNNLLITSNTGKRKMVNIPFIQHLENMISILVWLEILTLTRWEYQSNFLTHHTGQIYSRGKHRVCERSYCPWHHLTGSTTTMVYCLYNLMQNFTPKYIICMFKN